MAQSIVLSRTLVGCLGLAFCLPVASQAKYPVEVRHSGDDQVGVRYVFELREAIRASNSMRLVDQSNEPRIKVSVVTVDSDRNNTGVAAGIATTVVYDSMDIPLNGAHMTTLVQVCGEQRVAGCARGLLSWIDSSVNTLRQDWPSLWKSLFR